VTGELERGAIGKRPQTPSPGQPTVRGWPIFLRGDAHGFLLDSFRAKLESFDPDIADAIAGGERRQLDGVEVIPSESYTYPEVLAALGSALIAPSRYPGPASEFDPAGRGGSKRAFHAPL
jgi:hypothetical protein